jgi:hypothetical protein
MKIISFKKVVRSGFKTFGDFLLNEYPSKENIRRYMTNKDWLLKK